MKKLNTLLAFLAFTATLHAQTTTDNSLTVEEYVNEYLLGEGVEAFNVSYNGFDADQSVPRVGSFNATGSDFPFEEGMLMTTKDVQIATCGAGTGGSGLGSDPDLSQIVTGGLYDVTVVEFDFIPAGDSVSFNFIFASTEYHTYVCSNFNDVFGFFISGEGIDGPYTNQAENIALLPDGVTPVAINSVNNGSPSGSACTGGGVSCPCNSEYFIDNGGNTGNGMASDICFGGYTVSLTANASVVCGEIYHMKLAISNVSDNALNSGVFLEKGSFTSHATVEIEAQPISGGFEIGENDFTDGVLAGCSDARFCLTRNDTIGIDTTYFELAGSAQPGVQYVLPEEEYVIFPEGEDTICIDIISIQNELGAQVDSLTFIASSIDQCTGDTIETSASIAFYNEYSFDVSTEDVIIDCPTELVNISASGSQGLSPYSYEWALESDPETIVGEGSTIAVEPPQGGATDTYIVTVTDFCDLNPEFSTVSVTDATEPAPIVSTSPNDTINCVGQTIDLSATGELGQGDLEYSWSTGDEEEEITVTPGGQPENWYYVTVTDECGLTATDSVVVYFIPLDPPVADAGPDDEFNCVGQEVTLTGSATGGTGTYTYQWQGLGTDQSVTVTPNDTTTYYLTVTDDCGGVSEVDSVTVFFIPLDVPIAIAGADQEVVCAGDEVTLEATQVGGAPPYEYEWQYGPSTELTQNITVSPEQTTTYYLTITDNCQGVSETDSVTITVPVYDPITIELPQPTSVCPGDVQVLGADVEGGAGGYEYLWNTESENSSITVSPGLGQHPYDVTVTDQCGTQQVANTFVTVPVYDNIEVVPASQPSCTGDSFTLSVSSISGGAGDSKDDYFYAWVGPEVIDSTAISTDGTLTISNAVPGVYTLLVSDQCNNLGTAEVDADVLGIEFIPNVITPNNGDNINDVFVIPGSSVYPTKLTVMDRWGKVAYENDNYNCDQIDFDDPATIITPNTCWDGEDTKGDVFYYMIDVDNGACSFQGTLHLLDNQ